LNDVWAYATDTSGLELLAQAVAVCGDTVERATREKAVSRLREAAVADMLRHRAIRHVVDAFAATNTRMLLIKGAGLAYTIYPQPHLRPAADIDVFIAREQLDAAETALASAGYTREREPDAESASMQRHYRRRDEHDLDYIVDLHWRIANRHVFANALSFQDAWNTSQPVTQLGGSARTLGTADALLLACIHRVAHHHDDQNLLWLWDIHLLNGMLTQLDVEALAERAARSDMRAVVARGLELARAKLGTVIDPSLLATLCKGRVTEPSARFIGHHARHVELVLGDLAAVPTTGERVRLVWEHLFPDLAYMRAKYPAWPRPLLSCAYLYRIACGAPKWFRRSS
jgi:hypothetical protein